MATIKRSSGVTADSDACAYHSYEDVIMVHVNYTTLTNWLSGGTTWPIMTHLPTNNVFMNNQLVLHDIAYRLL